MPTTGTAPGPCGIGERREPPETTCCLAGQVGSPEARELVAKPAMVETSPIERPLASFSQRAATLTLPLAGLALLSKASIVHSLRAVRCEPRMMILKLAKLFT